MRSYSRIRLPFWKCRPGTHTISCVYIVYHGLLCMIWKRTAGLHSLEFNRGTIITKSSLDAQRNRVNISYIFLFSKDKNVKQMLRAEWCGNLCCFLDFCINPYSFGDIWRSIFFPFSFLLHVLSPVVYFLFPFCKTHFDIWVGNLGKQIILGGSKM